MVLLPPSRFKSQAIGNAQSIGLYSIYSTYSIYEYKYTLKKIKRYMTCGTTIIPFFGGGGIV